MSKPLSFNEQTDKWFDALATHATNVQEVYPALDSLLQRSHAFPSRANLVMARHWVEKLKPGKYKKPLLAQIDAVLGLKFRSEFHRHFHTYPKTLQSSACGEMLSMIRQALS